MLIVGLGNPGAKYEKNRHNAGWMQVDKFAKHAGLSFSFDKKHNSNIARGSYRGETITIIKPLTYMNLSGQSVVSVANYYKYSHSEIIVVYDDKDFDIGSFKIKKDGSSAGHNGIKSIISLMGTESFTRFRIGVGPKPKEMDMADFVLTNFSSSDMEILSKVLEQGVKALDSIIVDGIDKAMNTYNRKA